MIIRSLVGIVCCMQRGDACVSICNELVSRIVAFTLSHEFLVVFRGLGDPRSSPHVARIVVILAFHDLCVQHIQVSQRIVPARNLSGLDTQ